MSFHNDRERRAGFYDQQPGMECHSGPGAGGTDGNHMQSILRHAFNVNCNAVAHIRGIERHQRRGGGRRQMA